MISLRPGSNGSRRAAGKTDSAVDGIIRGKDVDLFVILEGGFEDVNRTGVFLGADLRAFELGEKTPPRQIEPLDDQKDQQEVGEVI